MDYVASLNELLEYYQNLLIVQYHNKPKAKATIKAIVNLILANLLILQIRDGFDWETAVGVQLDIIGKWVGVTRFYNGQLFYFRPWFALINWNSISDASQGGFSTYQNFNELDGGFLDYSNIMPTQNRLSDYAYRLMIGLKIIKNNIYTTCKNIDDAIWNYFDGKVYTVWEVDTLTYCYPQSLAEVIEVAKEKNVLPCPTGCKLVLREI